MYKLLPQKASDKAKKEYSLRRISVALGLLWALVTFSIVVLLPTTIFSLKKREAAIFILDAVDRPTENLDKVALDKWMDKVLADISAIAPDNSHDEVYSFFQKILAKKTPSISITSLSYMKATNGAKSFKAGGVAETRQALIAFQSELSNSLDWSQVDFPVSSIARELDIPFEITLLPPKPR